MIHEKDLIVALPERMHKKISPFLLEKLQKVISDSEVAERFKENLISYNSILSTGKNSVTDYVNAVMYVSYKLMGDTNLDAYRKTFPEKIELFNKQRKTRETINAHVSAYNKTKLVIGILSQSLIPTHVLNADVYQEAINVQANLMRNATREDVRQKAADSLMNHLAPPVETKLSIDVNTNGSSDYLTSLREQTQALIEAQRAAIRAGSTNATDVAKSKIIDVQ